MKRISLLVSILLSMHVAAEQCVPYARSRSGIQISGDAHKWWGQAQSKGAKPYVGSVMSLPRQGGYPLSDFGHVAVVSVVLSGTEILIDHANWDGQETRFLGVKVRDVSGNWTLVNIENTPGSGYGASMYTIDGFIYPLGMTAANPNCNHSSWKCSIRSPKSSNVGWFPPVDNCQQASQWYNMATVNGEKVAVGSATKASCPLVCYAN